MDGATVPKLPDDKLIAEVVEILKWDESGYDVDYKPGMISSPREFVKWMKAFYVIKAVREYGPDVEGVLRGPQPETPNPMKSMDRRREHQAATLSDAEWNRLEAKRLAKHVEYLRSLYELPSVSVGPNATGTTGIDPGGCLNSSSNETCKMGDECADCWPTTGTVREKGHTHYNCQCDDPAYYRFQPGQGLSDDPPQTPSQSPDTHLPSRTRTCGHLLWCECINAYRSSKAPESHAKAKPAKRKD